VKNGIFLFASGRAGEEERYGFNSCQLSIENEEKKVLNPFGAGNRIGTNLL